MRSLFALMLVVAAACGGPKGKHETSIVDEGSGSDTGEQCCCKSNPMTGDGTPVYETNVGRIECSSKHGECVDEVQCTSQAPVSDEPGAENGPNLPQTETMP